MEPSPPPMRTNALLPASVLYLALGPNLSQPHTTAYEDSQFAYQIMAGVSARASQHLEFRLSYRFRSSRRSMPILLRQASGSVFDSTLTFEETRYLLVPMSEKRLF